MTTFRADQVGSLLRPHALLDARAAHAAGRLDGDGLRAAEDAAIRGAIAMQEAAGIDVVTDGDFRRETFMSDFPDAVEGFVPEQVEATWQGRERRDDRGARDAHPRRRPAAPAPAPDRRPGRVHAGARDAAVQGHAAQPGALHRRRLPGRRDRRLLRGPLRAARRPHRDRPARGRRARRRGRPLHPAGQPALHAPGGRARARGAARRGHRPRARARRDDRVRQPLRRDLRPRRAHAGDPPVPRQQPQPLDARGRLRARSPRSCSTRSTSTRCCSSTTTSAPGGFEPLRFVPADKVVVLGLVSTQGAGARGRATRSSAGSRRRRGTCRSSGSRSARSAASRRSRRATS